MSAFVTHLETRKVGYDSAGRPVFRLLSPLVFWSTKWGEIIVPPGFNTNFCSVPRVPIAFWLFGDRGHEAGTLHDWLYTVRTRPRAEADLIFKDALQADTAIPPQLDRKVEPWRAAAMYQAVHLFGQSSWDADTLVPQPQNIAQTILAPDQIAP